ncbi:acyl-CoA/acyl-ACP dehydrogenase [Euzebya pacifica]|nr:acyl-CoA/acyl-ACP dehydrogenase [Euzebya pacifica]
MTTMHTDQGPTDRRTTIASTVRAAVEEPAFATALHGDPVARIDYLINLARTGSVSIARLVEAHLDAVLILDEAGLTPQADALYGVWASRGGVERHDGHISGPKPFCSGLGVVDRALVSGTDPGGGPELLLDVAAGDKLDGVEHVHGPWATDALADTATGTCRFLDHPVDTVVGKPGWYLARPGFWAGALRPAACWAGAALGLVDEAVAMGEDAGPHRLAHIGALHAAGEAMVAVLHRAAQHREGPGQLEALAARHTVERQAAEVLDRIGRAFGPRPYVGDAAFAQRAADLHLYLRQDHAEGDLEAVGRAVVATAGR